MNRPHIDNQKDFDWGRISGDYGRYRPGYPESFYDVLQTLGVGRPGQHILDLGTGTGVLARAFARRGAEVTGIDIAANQIEEARRLAGEEGIEAIFNVCPVEEMDFPDGTFDAASAGQSWLYFDAPVLIPKLLRALKEEGMLALTHFSWLPHQDEIARQMEALVLKHNPDWASGGFNGALSPVFGSLKDDFDLKTFHVMNEPIPFTRESWRGRIRACRGVGATLDDAQIEAFDAEHDALLRKIADDEFTVLHQMAIHIYVRKGIMVTG